MEPLISVIIPCYNQARYMPQTLDSVLAQTYKNWECILVNDGSTDDTANIAQLYCAKDSRFIYIEQVNRGLSNARNTGVRNVNGEYIQLLDADDIIEPDKLKAGAQFYSETVNDKLIMYASMRYFETDTPEQLIILGWNNFVAHIELKQADSLASQSELLAVRNPFVVSAPLYPRTLYKEIGGFDEELSALEDWDFHIRTIRAGYKFHHHYTDKGRTLIRLHDVSMMRNQRLLDENYHRVILKHQLSSRQPEASVQTPAKRSLLSHIKSRLR